MFTACGITPGILKASNNTFVVKLHSANDLSLSIIPFIPSEPAADRPDSPDEAALVIPDSPLEAILDKGSPPLRVDLLTFFFIIFFLYFLDFAIIYYLYILIFAINYLPK